jgi:hypothetical protein
MLKKIVALIAIIMLGWIALMLLVLNFVDCKEVKVNYGELLVNVITSGYEEYRILGMSEEAYLNGLKSCLKIIYSPKHLISEEAVKNAASKYFTDNIVEEIVKGDSQGSGDNTKYSKDGYKVEINYICVAYGKHQNDEITRVIADLTIIEGYEYKLLSLIMRINDKGKIYDIEVR